MTQTKNQKRRRRREAIEEKWKKRFDQKIKLEKCIDPQSICRRRMGQKCSCPFLCIKIDGCQDQQINGYWTMDKSKCIVKVFYFEKGMLHHIEAFKIGNPEAI